MRSVLVYSREAFTALYSKVLSMFVTIRDGSYNPDMSAVQRVEGAQGFQVFLCIEFLALCMWSIRMTLHSVAGSYLVTFLPLGSINGDTAHLDGCSQCLRIFFRNRA